MRACFGAMLLPQVVDRITAAHERLDFGETGRAFYDFFWAQFADWYIESAKPRLYDGADPAAQQTTRAVRPPPPGNSPPQPCCQPMHLHLEPCPASAWPSRASGATELSPAGRSKPCRAARSVTDDALAT